MLVSSILDDRGMLVYPPNTLPEDDLMKISVWPLLSHLLLKAWVLKPSLDAL